MKILSRGNTENKKNTDEVMCFINICEYRFYKPCGNYFRCLPKGKGLGTASKLNKNRK